jgi:ribonucleotide reductase alpha subunit
LGSILYLKIHKYQKEDTYLLFLLCYPSSIYKEKRRENMKKIQGKTKQRKKGKKERENNCIIVGMIFKLSFLCLGFLYFVNIQRKLKKEKTPRITNTCT